MQTLDAFTDPATRAAADIAAFLAGYQPSSAMGRQAKARMGVFVEGDEGLLRDELERVRLFLDASRREPAQWAGLRRALADLPDVVVPVETRSVADLFAVKRSAQAVQAIEELLGHMGLAGVADAKRPDVEPLVALLDPEGSGRRSFALYSEYSPALTELRRSIEKLAEEIGALEAAEERAAAARLGLDGIPSDGLVVDPDDERTRARLAADPAFRLLARAEDQEIYSFCHSQRAGDGRRELDAFYEEERREEDRTLARVTAEVNLHAAEIAAANRWLARVDCLAAKAELAARPGCCIPEVDASPDALPVLAGARNPTVAQAVEARGGRYHALDLRLEGRLTVVSGSNMSGKSCVLRTLGLVQILFQLGLPVPARSFRSSLFARVFLSSPGTTRTAHLSFFGAEMQWLAAALRCRTQRSLFLLDELAAGTGVNAATALSHAVLDAIDRSPSVGVVSTHVDEIAQRADADQLTMGGLNASGLPAPGAAPVAWRDHDFDLFDHTVYRGADRARAAGEPLIVAALCGMDREILDHAAARLAHKLARIR